MTLTGMVFPITWRQGQTCTIDIDMVEGMRQIARYAEAMEIKICGSQIPPDPKGERRAGGILE